MAEVDDLLYGGLDQGTVTILSGPTGVGKTTAGLQFLIQAALEGKQSILFQFEEAEWTIRKRADAIGLPLQDALDSGQLSTVGIDPEEYTVGEFEDLVREAVTDGTEVVMIDGSQGFQENLRGLDNTTGALLRIGRFLRAAAVSTILVNEVHNIIGDSHATEERTSDFERSLRELEITADGIRVGEPLPQLRGILTWTPEWNDTDTASKHDVDSDEQT